MGKNIFRTKEKICEMKKDWLRPVSRAGHQVLAITQPAIAIRQKLERLQNNLCKYQWQINGRIQTKKGTYLFL